MDKKYLYLFNEITDALFLLETIKEKLIIAQKNTEEMYLLDADAFERIKTINN